MSEKFWRQVRENIDPKWLAGIIMALVSGVLLTQNTSQHKTNEAQRSLIDFQTAFYTEAESVLVVRIERLEAADDSLRHAVLKLAAIHKRRPGAPRGLASNRGIGTRSTEQGAAFPVIGLVKGTVERVLGIFGFGKKPKGG